MRPQLAVITTVYRPLSHADVIVSRWLEPRPSDPEFGWPVQGYAEPRTQIASLYIEQFHDEGRDIDIGREILARHDVPLYNSIREALCLGGDELAVDGVILIGEHGQYPTNEWGQKKYPRREMFDAIVAVFRASGRSVPLFCDKHFSYDLDSVRHMLATARELDFPIMSGSTIPLSGALGEWDFPTDGQLQEAAGVFFGMTDINGYHSLQWVQSQVARRAGGESGIQSVTALAGESMKAALREQTWSPALMRALFENLGHPQAPQFLAALLDPDRELEDPSILPSALIFAHADGLRSSYFICHALPAEYSMAITTGAGQVRGARHFIKGARREQFCPHFALLCARTEEFMLGGATPYPLEHELLCTLMTRAACHALAAPGQSLQTPELNIAYALD